MGYIGRISLFSVSIIFSIISIIIFEEPLIEQIPTSIIVLVLSWFFGKQFDKVKFLSEKDYLTKLYNRRYVYHLFPKLKLRNVSPYSNNAYND